MSTKLERNLEAYDPELHDAILFTAQMEGVDVSPMIEGERFIGFGATKHGYGPACILDLTGTEYVAEPHVIWFPWTTKANRIVHFKWAMEMLAQNKEVLLAVEKKEKMFFEHFVKRKLLRKVGFLDNLPIVDEIHMYQYIKKEHKT